MKIRINSIKYRILSGFLLTIFISLILYILSYYYFQQINAIRSVDKELANIEVLTLNLIKTDNDFFDLESINPSYFTKKESSFLNKRDSIDKQISISTELKSKADSYFNIANELHAIDTTIERYNKSFEKLKERVFDRGFKDYGVEGEMRSYAHALENEIILSSILFLRRYEKDFLLRNELVYKQSFDSLANKIIKDLQEQREEEYTIGLVRSYKEAFDRLVAIQKEIGVNSNSGLRNELNQLTFSLNRQFSALSIKTSSKADAIITKVIGIYITAVAISLLVAVVVSYFLARRLAKPIKRLSALMQKYMSAKRNNLNPIELDNATDEIVHLSHSFFSLMKETQKQLNEIQEKSSEMKKKNKELKKLNDELDKFIYSTAHDLRSPLTSVLGLINIAEFDKGEAERDKYLAMMKSSISKMEAFIKDVVDYSKNKKLEIEIIEVDAVRLIEDVFDEHRFMNEHKEIELKITVDGNTPLYTDFKRIKIIFNNLISNAIRYQDPRKSKPFIHIGITSSLSSFSIQFEDNGQGILESHLKKIFKMFYRANEKSKGSGLGLFILKETVDALNGKVRVESAMNEGTTFKIDIPNRVPKRRRISSKKKQVA